MVIGAVWILVGLLKGFDLWGRSLFDLSTVNWLRVLSGVVVLVWSLKGAIYPTRMRFIPPWIVVLPVSVMAIADFARFYARYG